MYHIRLQKLHDFLKHEPNDPFLKYALATEYLNAKELDKAVGYFEDLLKNHSDYVGTYYHTGKLYEQIDRKDDAIATYQKGMDVCRKAGDSHAFSELQSAYNSVIGLDYEDD